MSWKMRNVVAPKGHGCERAALPRTEWGTERKSGGTERESGGNEAREWGNGKVDSSSFTLQTSSFSNSLATLQPDHRALFFP